MTEGAATRTKFVALIFLLELKELIELGDPEMLLEDDAGFCVVTEGATLPTKFVVLLFLLELKELKALCDPGLNPGLLDEAGIYDAVDGDDTP